MSNPIIEASTVLTYDVEQDASNIIKMFYISVFSIEDNHRDIADKEVWDAATGCAISHVEVLTQLANTEATKGYLGSLLEYLKNK